MDWRHNQWVGVGAAVLLVLAIVGIFLYVGGGGGGGVVEGQVDAGMTFQCEDTGETFRISGRSLEDRETYLAYFNRPGEGCKCEFDSLEDAYWVYWCEECQKYYKVAANQALADFPRCPEGHEVVVVGALK